MLFFPGLDGALLESPVRRARIGPSSTMTPKARHCTCKGGTQDKWKRVYKVLRHLSCFSFFLRVLRNLESDSAHCLFLFRQKVNYLPLARVIVGTGQIHTDTFQHPYAVVVLLSISFSILVLLDISPKG
eukprot:m.265133 g.265133  ORF g.265133 m.265133 type:complete len:129 (-) comp54678_c0_seq28:994-1380(-)